MLFRSDWSASSSLKQPKNHLKITPWVKFNSKILIKTQKLSTFCFKHNIKNIDFIWMDVQGAELDVIDGMEDFKKNIHYIYTEYSNDELYENQPKENQIIEALGKNWEIIYNFGQDILIKNNKYKI